MSATDEVLGGALRDLADQARTVRPAADVLWRAGRRRRHRGRLAASAVAMAGAAGVALALTVGGGQAGHGGNPGEAIGAPAPLTPSTPIRFEQVARSSGPPCLDGALPVPVRTGATAVRCLRFTGTGMTVTRVESARVRRNVAGQYELDIRMTPADARRFATLTGELAGLPGPRNRLAVVLNGHVMEAPVVQAVVRSGQAEIVSFVNKPQAQFFMATLLRRCAAGAARCTAGPA
jgi:SecD-like export protein